MTNMKFFSSNCYKTVLFSISKRLCKGSAQMDSDKIVVTNNHRMLQKEEALSHLFSYKDKHAYVIEKRQICLNNLNDTNMSLRNLNIKY
jgi:hypothetical protein